MGLSIGERMVKLDMDKPSARPDDWGPVLDKLLLGVTHNISNRVATFAGVSDIMSGDPAIPPILRALADEVPRLEEAIRLLRLLAAPEDEAEEALETTRLTDDAIALAALHPACRNIRFELIARRDVPPVVARFTALAHAIVLVLVAAAELYQAGDETESATASASGAPALIPIVFSSEGPDLVISAGSASVRARLLSAGRG
jgi:hypothetical protein